MATASLFVVFAALLAMGQAVAARHRAGAAADLAALATADRALLGREAACGAAAEVAGAQDATVVRCAVNGEIADVTAKAGFGPYRPEVRARAGPPDPPDRKASPVPDLPASSVSVEPTSQAGPQRQPLVQPENHQAGRERPQELPQELPHELLREVPGEAR
jgi:secretion/DNA translocation related TadE-like protein